MVESMNRTPSQGQYRDVANTLRDRIERGDYPRGSRLPTEDDLAAQLGVHRATVNRALKILLAEGLVRIHRGKGTFVTELPPIHRNASERYSKAARERAGGRGAFDAEVTAAGLTPRAETTIRHVTADDPGVPAAVTEHLSGALLVRARKMYANDIPVQLADSYIPAGIAEGTVLQEVDSGVGGMVSRQADLGFPQTQAREVLKVRPPTPEEREFLRMTEDQRVVDLVRIAYSGDRVVEVCVHAQPAHLWVHVYDLPVDPA
jgi:GntR family transcriptional regulator